MSKKIELAQLGTANEVLLKIVLDVTKQFLQKEIPSGYAFERVAGDIIEFSLILHGKYYEVLDPIDL